MLKKYADEIRNKIDEKNKILSDHKKRIDDLEDENIKLLKNKPKPKPKHTHTHAISKRENNEGVSISNTPKLHYY